MLDRLSSVTKFVFLLIFGASLVLADPPQRSRRHVAGWNELVEHEMFMRDLEESIYRRSLKLGSTRSPSRAGSQAGFRGLGSTPGGFKVTGIGQDTHNSVIAVSRNRSVDVQPSGNDRTKPSEVKPPATDIVRLSKDKRGQILGLAYDDWEEL